MLLFISFIHRISISFIHRMFFQSWIFTCFSDLPVFLPTSGLYNLVNLLYLLCWSLLLIDSPGECSWSCHLLWKHFFLLFFFYQETNYSSFDHSCFQWSSGTFGLPELTDKKCCNSYTYCITVPYCFCFFLPWPVHSHWFSFLPLNVFIDMFNLFI